MRLCHRRVMFIRENPPRHRIELSEVLLDVCALPHWTRRSRPVSKSSTSYREKDTSRRNDVAASCKKWHKSVTRLACVQYGVHHSDCF